MADVIVVAGVITTPAAWLVRQPTPLWPHEPQARPQPKHARQNMLKSPWLSLTYEGKVDDTAPSTALVRLGRAPPLEYDV